MSWKGKGLLGLAVIGVLLSCSTIDCPVNSLVETKYEFYSSTGETLTLLDTLTVVTARQDGIDTVFNKGSNISSFSLPISYSHPEDVFVFRFKGDGWQTADTVWIKKEDYPHFESVDCSAAFFHIITDVRYTCNYIDSIVIKNPSVTYDSKTVHFYFYPKSSN